MSRESDQKEIERFWYDMEQEIGEPVLNKGLIRVLHSHPQDLKDKWLLFFSSQSGLYYKRFPSGTAMGRLLNTAVKVEEYPLVYLPWEELGCSLREKGYFSRIFSGPDHIELNWGREQVFLLELDKRSRPIFEGRLE